MTLKEVVDAGGHETAPAFVHSPESPALIAFSSGSTGRPKPVVYTHTQVLHACRSILETYPELAPGTRLVCWLPLANLFQRMVNFCGMMNGATSFIVGDPRDVMQVLPIARPEVLVAVPRFCEKVHAGIMDQLSRRPKVARLVESVIDNNSRTRPDGLFRAGVRRLLFSAVDALVLSRMRGAFGGQLRFIVSGSAPMPTWLLERFEALGIPVLEAYGVSENIVPIAANRYASRRAGTVGQPVGDNVVRISPEGEVQVKGEGVFRPALQDSPPRSDAFTDDGFLATGDLGHFDDAGFLVLEGRRSEVFKNAQGRWIALPVVEAALRRVPGVEHAAVLRLDDDSLVGVLAVPRDDSRTAPDETRQRLGEALCDDLERVVHDLPTAMRPSAYVVVCRGFSPIGEEVTTNLKLRRAAIAARVAGPLTELRARLSSRSPEGHGRVPVMYV
jgi:long-chain acyl-CoA synthetase